MSYVIPQKYREQKRLPSNSLLPLTGSSSLTESKELGWLSVAHSRLEE